MILHNPIVSGSLTLSSNATFTANNGSVSGSGQIISLLPSGVVSGSSQVSLNGFDTDNLSEGSSNLYYTDTRVKTKLNTDGVISGSSQITDLTTHKETVSGASSYVIDHNLNEEYPIVQCWNTSTSQQEHAQSVTTNSENRVTVVFSTTFAGKIIVKK